MAMDFVAGCVGGCAGVVVGHPLDTVKVLMQVEGHHASIASCVRNVVAQGSVLSLYRGVTSPMMGVAFVNAIVFGVYGGARRRFADADSLRAHAASGAVAGLCQSLVCSPVELAKTRLQLGGGGGGALSCLAGIVRAEGVRGAFRGLTLTALRDTPAFACYFAAYEALARTADGRAPSATRTLMAGGLAGTASWLVSFPFDALKSRVQADREGRYAGACDCLRRSLRAEGPRFLFRGLSAVLLRAFPTNAACFWAVGWCMSLASAAEDPATTRHGHSCEPHYAAHAYRSLVFALGGGAENGGAICRGDVRDLHEDFRAEEEGLMSGLCRRCLAGVPALDLGILKEVEVNG